MGQKVSDRTALTKATLLDTDLVAVYREDALSAKMTAGELRKAMARPSVVTDATTARTLTEDDDGAALLFTNAGAIAVTVPDGLPLGFSCTILRGNGAGALTIQGDGTILLDDESNAAATGNTYAVNTRGVASVLVYNDTSPDTARVFGGIS